MFFPTIGIYFNARPEQGGLYQYALTLVDCLQQYVPQFNYILYHATLADFPFAIHAPNWRVIRLPKNQIKLRMGMELGLMTAARYGIAIKQPVLPLFQAIHSQPPDVMLYVKPTLHVFQWPYPSIFPIHDLQHRLQPEFPEVSQSGEFRRREYLYTNSTRVAAAILTDSEVGKEDVISCYPTDPGKIFPVSYIAPTFRAEEFNAERLGVIRRQYNLPPSYLFYPAAFWPHKNHARIIEALSWIKQNHQLEIPIVFAGSQNKEYPKIKALVHQTGMDNQVHFLGYVPDADLPALYRLALALVMPTFFGPTNIPILEAWSASCPVITSDIRGVRDQAGDAALLANPREALSIAEAIMKIYQSSDLRQDLVKRGLERVKNCSPEVFSEKLSNMLRQTLHTHGSRPG